jgi:hypothetical protein
MKYNLKLLLLLISTIANKAHCSWSDTLRSYTSKSARSLIQTKKSPHHKVLAYDKVTFLVNFDFACTVHAVPYKAQTYNIPSIAKQMDIENKKIALALKFYEKKNPKEKSFLVYPSGAVVHYHKDQPAPVQLVARNLAGSKSARSFFAR